MKHPSERHTPRKDIGGKIILEVKVENTCIGLSATEISSVPFRMSSVPFRINSLPLLDNDHREKPREGRRYPSSLYRSGTQFSPSDVKELKQRELWLGIMS